MDVKAPQNSKSQNLQALRQQLKEAREVVRSWPEWKQIAIGPAPESKSGPIKASKPSKA
jgi:hypothetical protein